MASEQQCGSPKIQTKPDSGLSREPSIIQSENRRNVNPPYKRQLSFQEGGGSPTSHTSLETSTTAANSRKTIERTPSQFNPALLDRQSIRSSRSYSNLSQRDVVVQNCNNAIALYNPYYQQQMSIPNDFMSMPPPPFSSPNPLWYQQYMVPPPLYFAPQPLAPDFETFRKAMKLEKKKMEADVKKSPGPCAQFCCSGVSQLLWAIVALACIGLLIALFLALFVI